MNRMEETLEILKDKEWHTLGEIINKIGDQISPEKATQLYPKHIKNPAPLDQQVFLGRRWAIMKMMNELVRQGRVVVKGEKFKREFKLPDPYSPQSPDAGTEDDPNATITIENPYHFITEFEFRCLKHIALYEPEKSDLQFHIRAIRRIMERK